FVNGDTLAGLATPPVLSTIATTASPVGAYPISVAGATSPNYTITFAGGTLTVGRAALTITANDASKTYGGPVPVLSASGSGFVNGDTLASLATPPVLSTIATSASPVGAYPISVAGATSPNYTIAFAGGTLTVGRAPLTITADNKSMTQGFPLPPLTASYAGFVNGDTVASLATPVTLSTTATPASPMGTYPIVPSGASGVNYTIAFVNGTMTVSSLSGGTAAARDVLAGLLPGASPATAGLINNAIGRINDALDPSLWRDASHLTSQGQKAFEDLRQGIGELLKISNPPPAVAGVIQQLLSIARQLASDAIGVAQSAGRNVAQAQSFLADADARRAAGDWDGAMQRYKQAWQQVN
ncbi:MAG TPA: MBG domain-containing protein, partial [Vicinamibacterales bacterium]|nr:MBG domain-containing protein [Vicinamibacterales bacterium]